MIVNGYDDKKLCNAALTLIGEAPINSLENPTTDIEAACANLWPLVRAEILSCHEWNFANPIRQLAANADADENLKGGFKHAFALPADLVAGPQAVYANGDFKRPVRGWENVMGHILTNDDVIHARYRNDPDIGTWPMLVVSLGAHALSARLAKSVTDSSSMTTEMRIMAYGPADMGGRGGLFAAARKADAMSQPMRSMFQNGDPLSATRY